MSEDVSEPENHVDGQAAGSRRLQLVALIFLGLGLALAFSHVARGFLTALILAGIFAVLVKPVYQKFRQMLGGNTGWASALTLLASIIAVIGPMLMIAYLAASQAREAVQGADQLIGQITEEVTEIRQSGGKLPDWVPFREQVEQAAPQLIEKGKEWLGQAASLFVSALSGLTNGTASFFLSLFTFLYALFFFVQKDRSVFAELLEYSGLSAGFQLKLVNRINSVSRATIKGSLSIGLVQGALGGLGFWAVGFDGAVFWAVIMAILAVIPGVGATPVVICGAIYLGFTGEIAKAVGLGLWAMLVVGSIDNVLRPKLVGKDAGMSDLWIFVSTLGGLATFGAAGLILGPVLAGLLIETWTEISRFNEAPALESETGDELQEGGGDDDDADAPPEGKSMRLTVSRSEMDAEVQALRRELETSDD